MLEFIFCAFMLWTFLGACICMKYIEDVDKMRVRKAALFLFLCGIYGWIMGLAIVFVEVTMKFLAPFRGKLTRFIAWCKE